MEASSTQRSSGRNLANVPEEGRVSPKDVPQSPSPQATASSVSTASGATSTKQTTRKTASVRTLGRSSSDQLAAASSSSSTVKRATSSSSSAQGVGASGKSSRSAAAQKAVATPAAPKQVLCPTLPHDKNAQPAPSTIMYWSRAPVWGSVPTRTMRAHTATLVDTTVWIFGGCDDRDSSKDVYCFDTGEWLNYIFAYGSSTRTHNPALECVALLPIVFLCSSIFSRLFPFSSHQKRCNGHIPMW